MIVVLGLLPWMHEKIISEKHSVKLIATERMN